MKKTKQRKKPVDDGKVRVPRTAGLTMAMKAYHVEDDQKQREKLYKRIQERILHRYIEDGYQVNGKVISITELADFVDMPVGRVIKATTKVVRSMTAIGDGEDGLQDTYRALLAMTVQGALADRGTALNQVQVLKREQGDRYVPFLTSALNGAIKNQMDSLKPIADLVKTLTPSDPTTVINNNNQQANNQNYIGTNEAVKMIDAQREQPLLESGTQQEALGAQYLEGDVPEIVATKQRGWNLKSEAISLEPKKRKKGKGPGTHEGRREDDGEIID